MWKLQSVSSVCPWHPSPGTAGSLQGHSECPVTPIPQTLREASRPSQASGQDLLRRPLPRGAGSEASAVPCPGDLPRELPKQDDTEQKCKLVLRVESFLHRDKLSMLPLFA